MGTGETLKSNRQGQGQKGRGEALGEATGWLAGCQRAAGGEKAEAWRQPVGVLGQHTWDLKGLRAARGGATGTVAVRLHSVEEGKSGELGHPFLRAGKDPTQRMSGKAGALVILSAARSSAGPTDRIASQTFLGETCEVNQ